MFEMLERQAFDCKELKLMKRALFSSAAILIASAVVSPVSQAVDFDQLRRENLEKDQNNLGELQQPHLRVKVDFDQLRRENLEKDQNNFDELRDQHLDVKTI